jgi:hypothetical protein
MVRSSICSTAVHLFREKHKILAMIPPLESCSQKDVQYHRPRPLAFYFSIFSPRGPCGQGILIKDARGLEDGRKNNLLRNRCGHFWERRFRAYLVEDDLYALAALRYMDRNTVRAGIVEDPGTYAWSSCASYALEAPKRLIQFHPSYLGLSPYAKVRQRHYRAILIPSSDPHLDDRDSRWTSQRAVGSPEFLKRHHPSGRRQGIIPLPEQIRKVGK